MKEYKAEIIAVGTELLLGQIANTNAQWISDTLARHGVNVFFHGVVGDNLERVKSTFELANDRSDLVIITGGLGPTDDDLTREAFQAMTNEKLVEHPESMNKILNYFKKTNRKMTPNNKKQALVFEGAQVIYNNVGMAPGMISEYNDTIWIFMPGVPREMKSIMTDGALPYLKDRLNLSTVIQSRMLRFIGIGESQLEHDLKKIIDHQSNPTIAPLATDGEVALRITAKGKSIEEANNLIDLTEKKVLNIVGDYFYGYDEETIQSKILSLLKEKETTIATAESLTGGSFSDSIVSIPGASEVFNGGIVCYSTDVKKQILQVSSETIDKYGTISEPCAEEMAKNIQTKLHANVGISFTGVAGPDKSEGKDVGTVFISIYHASGKSLTESFQFFGDRESIRIRTVKKGLELLFRFIKNKI
ncbi:competence/damage-inducible protein A [Aquibacillus albus]|uniref:Putative competence-damage inducible protein n=1 Tax=Aquibacillus albus TaxID=1168171 RepID=A0ABS2N1T9_9BACI|nr:competence/damage-inducible protein A [Aquibacillus albus]MBM7572096.1 nicotinamide-nucleotide amidase [Aquibacillus albus]